MRPKKRAYVWLHMQRLADAGLGTLQDLSELRDNFLLREDHPAKALLSTNPGIGGVVRFVRADPGGLLFRDAAEPFLQLLPADVLNRAMKSRKGLEFRWTKIEDQDVRALFDAVLTCAAGGVNAQPGGPKPSPRIPVSQTSGHATSQLERRLAPLLEPVQDQWLRPWMTTQQNPALSQVFIVGRNQTKTYPVERLSRARYLDSHFNRNGESCRSLYDELTEGRASPTRRNIDVLSNELSFARVLETNIVCYSTHSAAELLDPAHAQGFAQGLKIFPVLLDEIRPKVLILYGAGVIDMAQKYVRGLPRLVEPHSADDIQLVEANVDPFGDRFPVGIIVIPSLSPPRFNQWSKWWPQARRQVVSIVRQLIPAN